MNGHHSDDQPATSGTNTDPVCGMTVAPSSPHTAGTDSEETSAATPGNRKQQRPVAPPPPAASTEAIYTCPMHPEVRQVGPGSCPICGMALEPVLATGAGGEDAELSDMRRRFWVAVLLTAPLVAHAMMEMFGMSGIWLSKTALAWSQLALATPVIGDKSHIENFLKSIRGDAKPNSEIAVGQTSTLLCHLANIAYRTGHTLRFDSTKRKIIGDPEAEKLWGREYRPGWEPKECLASS